MFLLESPFLIHAPSLQAGNTNDNGKGPGPSNNNGGGNPGTSSNGGGGSSKKTLKDLWDSIQACDTSNHGAKMSLLAQVRASIHGGNSTRTDSHLTALKHELSTPAAEKHAGACVDQLKDMVDEMLSS